MARTPSIASADVTGLQPGAHSASTEWASALNAGPGDLRRQPERQLGVVDDHLRQHHRVLPVCLWRPPVSP